MKKLLFSAFASLVVSAAVVGAYAHNEQSQIDPAILENVEALSKIEEEVVEIPCAAGGDECVFRCKIGGSMGYCSIKEYDEK